MFPATIPIPTVPAAAEAVVPEAQVVVFGMVVTSELAGRHGQRGRVAEAAELEGVDVELGRPGRGERDRRLG